MHFDQLKFVMLRKLGCPRQLLLLNDVGTYQDAGTVPVKYCRCRSSSLRSMANVQDSMTSSVDLRT